MDLKRITISAITGSIIYFLLGFLFYGILFPDIYPATPETKLSFIYLGGLVFCLLIAVVFDWLSITNAGRGLRSGAVIGFLTSLSMNFSMYAGMQLDTRKLAMDVILTTIMSALVGADIAIVNSKLSMKKQST